VTKNFGIIYAGACLAIKEKILPWNQQVLLECIRSCFFDALGGIPNPDAILNAGIARLRDILGESSEWPPFSEYTIKATGFSKSINGRSQFVSYIHDFRKLFDDENQTRMVLNWLHKRDLLKVSKLEDESLEAAIWKGSTPKWPDGNAYRSYVFFSPFENTPESDSKQINKVDHSRDDSRKKPIGEKPRNPNSAGNGRAPVHATNPQKAPVALHTPHPTGKTLFSLFPCFVIVETTTGQNGGNSLNS
jgi:hypothetical protein